MKHDVETVSETRHKLEITLADVMAWLYARGEVPRNVKVMADFNDGHPVAVDAKPEMGVLKLDWVEKTGPD